MPIYRAEKNKDYTVMSNAHLKDGRLSLKAKGLLSYMLSLPDDWKFSTRGLVAHCREGADAVRVALKELEAAGYLHRTRIRSGNGSFAEEEWEIHEIPERIFRETRRTEEPRSENPVAAGSDQDKPTLLNTRENNICICAGQPEKSTPIEKIHGKKRRRHCDSHGARRCCPIWKQCRRESI